MLIRFTLFAVETLFSLNVCVDPKTKLLPNKSAVIASFTHFSITSWRRIFCFHFLVETFRLTLGITQQLS